MTGNALGHSPFIPYASVPGPMFEFEWFDVGNAVIELEPGWLVGVGFGVDSLFVLTWVEREPFAEWLPWTPNLRS
ncbi:hypothetical protein [Pseudomonas phage vB_PaeM_RP7]|uniref:Uncharacterized protein n=2 Tax=Nankokuvirus TaxID=1925779 RepID=V5JVE9_9CAUD|nr:hypothetical protein X837_gp109 [Pseudomonas phage CHA_P1]QEM41035.1 hypothetical protein PAPJP_109 [Pseudomonas phage PAP-JP]UKH48032.1 MAG: hypothetical protein [Pseudomonas phage RP4]WAB56863.1 hypothetical protein [Pseudomonas phage vB_PaeM_RP15]WAB56979.1 hypothetical protein [Pseudomonas phage vB_PaeM_RP6]WAB57112.1 hypothetical protein [Pseudomonas phage vB_PaeM_RP7]WAB57249.1 hypothetical protein [Pseudomonas phage vB_PaeM_RP8]WAB57489.1 hypothetical protein [Pseudomonas phage vB_